MRKPKVGALVFLVKTLGIIAGLSVITAACFFFAIEFYDVAVPLFYQVFPKKCVVTDQIIEVDDIANPSNDQQDSASVVLGAYKGNLYFYPKWCLNVENRNKYYKTLCVLKDGEAKKLIKIQQPVLKISNGCVYYVSIPESDSIDKNISLYRFIIASGKTELVNSDYVFPETQAYDMNGARYTVTTDNSVLQVNNLNGAINETKLDISYGEKQLIPCKYGLLIHNEGPGTLLYMIEEKTGRIIELFSVQGERIQSTVNIWDNYAYISLSRSYFDEDLESTVFYNNDVISGTYKVGLKDYSIEKISDEVYNGLFIFDDSGIYACTEELIVHKLDHFGKIIVTVME